MTHSGGKPHSTGDKGQRYEVTFYNPEVFKRQTLGWAETEKGAKKFSKGVKLHPSWCDAKIYDRVEHKYVVE